MIEQKYVQHYYRLPDSVKQKLRRIGKKYYNISDFCFSAISFGCSYPAGHINFVGFEPGIPFQYEISVKEMKFDSMKDIDEWHDSLALAYDFCQWMKQYHDEVVSGVTRDKGES